MMTKTINIECALCEKTVQMTIDEEKILSESSGTFNIIFVHGTPLHGINVYVDRNLTVRAVEYPDMFNMFNIGDTGDSSRTTVDTTTYMTSDKYELLFSREQNMFMIKTMILGIIDRHGPICAYDIHTRLMKRSSIISERMTIDDVKRICREFEERGIITRHRSV